MLKIGMIGGGRMGSAHAARLAKMEGLEIKAIYDIDPEKSKIFSKAFGAAECGSADELVKRADVDWILICSPTYCHAEGLRAALKTGKPVFCEKPLCRTKSELDEIAPLVTNYKNLFAIGFVRRYSAGTLAVKKFIDAGKIGKPLCGEVRVLFGGFARQWGDWFADYDKSGGVMLDMLAHHADLQNYFIGEPESVYADALMLNKANGLPCDFVSASVRYRNGYIGNMECSWVRSGPTDNSITIVGDQGALTLSDTTGLIWYHDGTSEGIPLDEKTVSDVQQNVSGGMYEMQWVVLVDCIRRGKKPYAGADAAVKAMKMCLGMMESAETGRKVMF